MVDVAVTYDFADNCDPTAAVSCVLGVVSNEPVDGLGDGDAAPDWEVLDGQHVRLRLEQAGSGTGRNYTISITCGDSRGHSSTRATDVVVPKSQKEGRVVTRIDVIRGMALLHVLLAPVAAVCGYILAGFFVMLPELLRTGTSQYGTPLGDLWLGVAGLGYIPLLVLIPLSFAAALGLWRLRRWGRWLALGLSSMGALTASNGMFWQIRHMRAVDVAWPPHPERVLSLGLLVLAWYGLVLWYMLRRDVAEVFHGKGAPAAADTAGVQ
jgi:hypothetical protein